MAKYSEYPVVNSVSASDLLMLLDISDQALGAAGSEKLIALADLLSGVQPLVLPGAGDNGAAISAAALASVDAGAAAYLGGFDQSNGIITLANRVYPCSTTIELPPGCDLIMPRGCVIAYSGTGPAIRSLGHQPGNSSGVIMSQGVGTRIFGGIIDGSAVNPTAIACGIQLGGQYDMSCYGVTVQNFTSTGTDGWDGYYPLGAVGFNLTNTPTLSEKGLLRDCTVNNCGPPNRDPAKPPSEGGGAGVQYVHPPQSKGGAQSGSHMYCRIERLHLNQQPGQNGLVIAKDGQPYFGHIGIIGNMWQGDTTPNNAAVIVVGVGPPGNSQHGKISGCTFDVKIEANKGDAPGGQLPYTIWFGPDNDNVIGGCGGWLRFGTGGFRNSNVPVIGGSQGDSYRGPAMQFDGTIIGDSELRKVGAPGTTNAAGGPALATPVFGTTYYNEGNSAHCFIPSGYGTTNITWEGVSMGITSGIFPMKMGASIKIDGNGAAPPWKWVTGIAHPS